MGQEVSGAFTEVELGPGDFEQGVCLVRESVVSSVEAHAQELAAYTSFGCGSTNP